MYIGRIDLKGFKSFGGVHQLPLEMGMVAIVGPNGSGKSNILDAIKWTLGEGAPSKLRISKQSDLLFQGSMSMPPAREAEVSILFRDGASSTIFTRRVQQDGTTLALVDGQRRTLLELEDAKRRIKMEGDRFAFIGQGEVSEVIQQRPMARRMLLESLLGIDFYRRRRNESSDRLKGVAEDLGRLMAFYGELLNRRREISREVEMAQEVERLRAQLEELQRCHYWWRRSGLEAEIREISDFLRSAQEERAVRTRWLKVWRSALAGLEAFGVSLKDRRAESEEALERARREMEELRRRGSSLGAVLMELRRSGEESSLELKTLEASKARMEEELREAVSQREESLREMLSLREQESSLSRKAEEVEERLRLGREAAQAAVKRSEEAKAALGTCLASLKALGVERLRGLEELRLAEESVEESRRSVAEAQAAFSEAEGRAEESVGSHRKALGECQALAEKVQAARREISKLRSSLEDMEETLELEVFPRPVQQVVSAARLGKLDATPRVLADVFRCPKEISGALDAFLGGRQFWILVRDMEESGRCIDFLKSRSLGRATFLPLERCVPRRPDRSLAMRAGVVGFAIDLIEVAEEYRPAMEHILGDLLVVEDYQVGKEITRTSFRGPVVTLEGDVFQPTGAVSGGRSKSQRSAVEMRQAIEAGRTRLKELEARLGEMEAALSELETREAELADLEKKCLQEVSLRRRELEEARLALSSQEARRDRQAGVLMDLDRSLKEAGRKVLELRERSVLPQGLEDLSKVEEELKAALESHRQVSTKLALAEERHAGASALADRVRSEVERLSSRLDHLRWSYKDREGRIASAVGELGEIGVRWMELRGQLVKAQRDLESAWSAMEALSAKYDRCRDRMARAMEALGRVDMALEELRRREASCAKELEDLMTTWEEVYPYPGVYEGPPGDGLRGKIRELERAIREMGPVDMGVLSESRSLDERLEFLKGQIDDSRRAMADLERVIAEADQRAQTVFMRSLKDIDDRFDSLFKRLFGGGEAHLEVMDSGGLWDSGVEITARPPGKRPQGIAQLSGGEQSLTAVALLFSSLEVAGCPIAVLDEVDAALDEVNLRRFADLAAESSAERQILVMTHRRITMERAGLLYGVTLREPGLSQVVGVKLEEWD
ncbi:chromosome segregation protein SMC [Thermanaerovibrio velox DSM 12556]|uniref:Chromosome partition protein Smc n=1 Tax=Thermanaerovibrio velox DSM 12556 TaxID=926567 RepID=H0UQH1_9BACT|nr:chromosome segregation protein SMC [Thermanaerovibrio velox]EHM09725.1 chromosome segregation protein SMC [Thermanaerovibrio velox DSM 12556]